MAFGVFAKTNLVPIGRLVPRRGGRSSRHALLQLEVSGMRNHATGGHVAVQPLEVK